MAGKRRFGYKDDHEVVAFIELPSGMQLEVLDREDGKQFVNMIPSHKTSYEFITVHKHDIDGMITVLQFFKENYMKEEGSS